MRDGPLPEPAGIELSIVMPCLNEAETLAACIGKARRFIADAAIVGEIVVADNGSTDGSREIALRAGARVVDVRTRGYGAALRAGIEAAAGRYVIVGDADESYDFSTLAPFMGRLRAGEDLVIGNRFAGGIAPGAMPLLHRYLGNPLLSFVGRLFFGTAVRDFHCGLRGFDRAMILRLPLRATGMEFASEMVVKAALAGLRIAEVPTTLAQDGRSRPPHLRTWRDGWRHLAFLLLHSPRWLFLIPGVSLFGLGLLVMLLLLPGSVVLGGIEFDVHTLLAASAMVILGMQAAMSGVLAIQFAGRYGVLPRSGRIEAAAARCTLERTLGAGLLLALGGAALLLHATLQWRATDFGALDYRATLREVVPATTLLIAGGQTMAFAFFSSLLRLGGGRG